MKKLLLSALTFITACSNINLLNDNANCIDVQEFKVLQALNNGALAYECNFSDGCSVFNQIVFLDNQRSVDYYDGMIVKAPQEKCAVRDGVYKYTNKENTLKTVPVIKFEYKNYPKDEKEIARRKEEYREDIYLMCLNDFEANKEKRDTVFCKCYSETWIDILSNEELDREQFVNNLNSSVKKNCGKLPKFLSE